MPAECVQFPATAVTGAAGFSSLIRRKSSAELFSWSSTTSSAKTPEHLQRHPREGDRARVVDGTAPRVRAREALRHAADLPARQLLKGTTVGEAGEVAVAPGEIRRRVERGGAGEERVVTSDQQQRLLSAHAAAHRVDAVRPDPQPGERRLRDVLHVREVVDLPRPAPRVQGQHPSVSLGADHREPAAGRQVAPEPEICTPCDTPPMRRDDQRHRRVVRRAEVGR